jgi:hypothetical protein
VEVTAAFGKCFYFKGLRIRLRIPTGVSADEINPVRRVLSFPLVEEAVALSVGGFRFARRSSGSLRVPILRLIRFLVRAVIMGPLLRLQSEFINAKTVVEIGASNGVSAIWLSRALRKTDGKLITTDSGLETISYMRGRGMSVLLKKL